MRLYYCYVFLFKQKTAYEMRIIDWSSDVCSSDLTGRKGKGGFYRAKGKEALDLTTGDYRPVQRANLDSAKVAKKGLRALVEHPDKGGQYARSEERRVGKECGSQGRSRWAPDN